MIVLTLALAATSGIAGCVAPADAPGMVARAPTVHTEDGRYLELARTAPRSESTRVLLVVFPRSACSGSASTVLVDRDGRFVGAVAPGTATLLELPSATASLVAVSSVELEAPVGMSSFVDEVPLPAAPGGLLLESWRWSTRTCGTSGHYADVRAATKEELEVALGEHELRWLSSGQDVGDAWLEERSERLSEVLATERARQAKRTATTRHARR